MAPQEDQQVFDPSPTASRPPVEPANRPPDSIPGPEFDASAPGIPEKEDALRRSAAELKAALEVLGEGCDTREGYEALQRELEARLPGLYLRYDAYVSALLETGREKVACSKACSHCCSHYVTSVEPYELLFMHGRIRARGDYASRVIALHRRATLFNGLVDPEDGDEAEDKALYRYFLRGAKCPFLAEGGGCGVYESRPMSCRMFFSMSHPSLCKGKGVIDPGNRNFLIELPEDIEADLARAGAAFSRFAFPERLFEGLLRANELFGRFDSEETAGLA